MMFLMYFSRKRPWSFSLALAAVEMRDSTNHGYVELFSLAPDDVPPSKAQEGHDL